MDRAAWLASEDPAQMLGWRLSTSRHGGVETAGPVSDRKLRLFACGCCRAVWHLLTDERSRRAVEVAERFADREATTEEYHGSWNDAWQAGVETLPGRPTEPARAIPWLFGRTGSPGGTAAELCALLRDHFRPAAQAALLREVVGDPFAPVTRTSAGIDHLPKVANGVGVRDYPAALARHIYDARDFAALPVIADALEEAGCDAEALLRHLRGEEPAVKDDPSWRAPRECMVMNEDLECVGCGAKLAGRTRCALKPPSTVQGWRPLRSPHVRGCWALDLLLGKE